MCLFCVKWLWTTSLLKKISELDLKITDSDKGKEGFSIFGKVPCLGVWMYLLKSIPVFASDRICGVAPEDDTINEMIE